ncbi:MAG: GAF domain-containing sensor histidine kinase, partial [Chloroflexi bacterium]|nr:GAF domain-containing sensor histidine kinase [Chloroflexota bacterium]
PSASGPSVAALPTAFFLGWMAVALIVGFTFAPFLTPLWWTTTECAARYILGFPGAGTTALGLGLIAHSWKGKTARRAANYLRVAAVAFAVYAVLAGLVVFPAPFFPASSLNTAWFISTFGVPPQLFRALSALIIAVSVAEVLVIEASRSIVDLNRLLVALNESSQAIVSRLELGHILDLIVVKARQLLQSDTAFLSLADEDGMTLEMVASVGVRTEALRHLKLRSDQGLAGLAAEKREPVVTENYPAAVGLRQPATEVLRNEGIVSGIAAPLLENSRLLGVLYVFNRRPTSFTDVEARLLGSLANQAAVAIDHARLYAKEKEHVETLRELDRAKDEFFSVATHELKNPLTTIKGFSQLLLRKVQEPGHEEELKIGNIILGQTDRLIDLVNTLLDVSRIQTGRFELHLQSTNLVSLIRRVVDEMQVVAPRHQINLGAEPAAIVGNWDPARLEEVFVNLVDNAVKYSPKGERIDVSVSSIHGFAQVTVRDYGPGIPEEDRPHIFERFYRVPPPKGPRPKGLGLGLFISKEIVTQLGGSMWFESEEGKGTTFYVSLPLQGEAG